MSALSALRVLPREVLARCLEFLSFDQALEAKQVSKEVRSAARRALIQRWRPIKFVAEQGVAKRKVAQTMDAGAAIVADIVTNSRLVRRLLIVIEPATHVATITRPALVTAPRHIVQLMKIARIRCQILGHVRAARWVGAIYIVAIVAGHDHIVGTKSAGLNQPITITSNEQKVLVDQNEALLDQH